MKAYLLLAFGLLFSPLLCVWPTPYSCLISAGIAFFHLGAGPPREHVVRARYWIALTCLAFGIWGPWWSDKDRWEAPFTWLVSGGIAVALLLLVANAIHVSDLEGALWHSPPLDPDADEQAYDRLSRRLWLPLAAVSSTAFAAALWMGWA